MKKTTSNNMLNNNIVRIALATVGVLLIPLVAMQFTDEVKWDLMDFVVIGALLFGAGLLYELVTKRIRNKNHRIAIGIAFLAAVIIIWVELAVGIFD